MVAWRKLDRPFICASASPRRKAILELMGFDDFLIAPSEIDESAVTIDPADGSAGLKELALRKARHIAAVHPKALVLGADTSVIQKPRILGKPRDRDDAAEMLSLLSGKSHIVMTGVALVCGERDFTATAVASTTVKFRDLSPAEIDEYLTTGEAFDKAGSYAIQGTAMTFVEWIEGCYYNVVGLPVTQTINLLTEYHLTKEYGNGRKF